MSDTPETSRWIVPLLFAGFFAGVTAAIWFTLDHFDVGLRRFGWPFSSVLTLALLNAFGGFKFGRAFEVQRLRRAAAREDPVVEDESEEPVDDNLPEMPVFANRVDIERRRTERVNGVAVDLFDLTTETSDGDGGTVRTTRTIALMTVAGLPSFELRPSQFHDLILKWAGAVGLEFDERAPGTLDGQETVAEFAATYRVTAASAEAMISGTADADEAAVRRVFPLRAMQLLLGRSDWHLESHGGHLACWVEGDVLGKKRREQFVTEAAALRGIILAANAGAVGEPLAAPQGVVPVRQQAARLQASLLGGVLGAFASFFAAAVLHAGEVFGKQNMMVMFPLVIVSGVILGATIGRLLPLRRPVLQKPKDERREKFVGCACLLGLFGGFFAGGIGGFITGELIGLQMGDHKQRAMLFFGGMGLGTFSGPVILGMTANYLYLLIRKLRKKE